MPVPLHTQTVIAFIWDFDRTLIPDNMQWPIFQEYGVDEATFWREVDGLIDYHKALGETMGRGLAYLI
ncbi:MAG: haloacid dehalogenase-like hydrolase, partial [Acidimicrobiia bacterium]